MVGGRGDRTDVTDIPHTHRVLDAVIPPVAQWLVRLMRRLEEDVESPAAR